MRRSTSWVLALVLVSVALAGCGDEEESTTREFAATAYGNPICDTPNGRLTTRRQLRLFANPGLDVARMVIGLQRYYRRYGITFFASTTIETTDLKHVQDLDNEALNAKLRQDFPGVEVSDAALTALAATDRPLFDRIVATVLRFQFSGLLSFLEQYHLEGQGVTNVVLLDELVSPKSPAEVRAGLLGIALSPFLLTELARTGMDAQRTIPLAGFSPDFAPVVFLCNRTVNALEKGLRSEHRGLVAAHEFGHSAGLVHREDTMNLMYPRTSGRESCALALDDDQVTVMQQGLGLSARPSARVRVSDGLVAGQGGEAARELWPAPALLAGVIRGEGQAQRAFLAPFHGGD